MTAATMEAGKEYITIKLAEGEILLELYRDVAPNTVDNFIKLTEQGFYDGLTFHRVVEGFVVQGGCPQGTGMGGPGYNIDAEFNDRPHKEGTVAMARSQDPNSAGSQFYIVTGPHSAVGHLDGQYTVFGHVLSGMEQVYEISQGDKMEKVTYTDKR